ncbi:MAG: amino acid ABC transporter permease [Ectothiorhodospiraceae bacterium]|nr:amino acid ABC transporter permease [Chromatiales bacterium]MCP5156349.1 amino acid ABC transporter permease [Ectothiorhodospiraceae bacterium]
MPGIGRDPTTDLPVLHRCSPVGAGLAADLAFSRWLGSRSPWVLLGLAALLAAWPFLAHAQSGYSTARAFEALWRWIPFLLRDGFAFNILISFVTMAIGTAAGVVLGLWQIAPSPWVRRTAWAITQTFRNSPWLVLLFIVMLTFPFEIRIGDAIVPIPDWMKAVLGLALPVMANVSEVVRGAIQSVPTGQWEASESLAFSRRQTLWRIILPQCFKRMIPPWMNWYAILTMATPLVSLLGVEEIVTLSRQAMEAEDNHPELLMPFYGFALLVFFAYCYPIARWTIRLERRFAVKL